MNLTQECQITFHYLMDGQCHEGRLSFSHAVPPDVAQSLAKCLASCGAEVLSVQAMIPGGASRELLAA